ncbi:uroporphyrinogen-III C-methyltransferase [Marinomonas pollencensis]|uniref:Uroporphyrin-3 C-methyltransferase n=1 Tax=Marinomonas pollencensis TaxID=491954 RepID=A0A3E0DJY1_9GAMM|nr:uroporphyrinogen-III C-methyltransferase [Marinomonas pollencensis]REG83019.1 uroporphyrin-3 C-methyltransferase [Marinomonas pollencensis]
MTETNKHTSEHDVANSENSQNTTKEPSNSTLALAPLPKALIATSIVISIVALGASGWLFYQSQQNSTQSQLQLVKEQQAKITTELESHNQNHNQLTELSEQVSQAEQHSLQQTSSLQAQQSKQQTQLQTLENRIRQINSANKEDWKLAEAEYLVRLANQRVLLEADLNGAEALLKNADDILAELEDPLFFDARKAIAKDIQALKSTSHFDVEGRYLQLGALYDQVSSLPQREPSKKWQANNQAEAQGKLEQTSTQVTNTLTSIWDSIKSLVVINYNHTPIKTLLPPAEYQELVTGLQLQIDVAQVALVKGESSIYQKALSRVADAINAHFDTRSQKVIAFMTSLTSLQQVNPNPELPQPRDSLTAMKKMMKQWNARPTSPQQSDQVNTSDDAAAPADEINQNVTDTTEKGAGA